MANIFEKHTYVHSLTKFNWILHEIKENNVKQQQQQQERKEDNVIITPLKIISDCLKSPKFRSETCEWNLRLNFTKKLLIVYGKLNTNNLESFTFDNSKYDNECEFLVTISAIQLSDAPLIIMKREKLQLKRNYFFTAIKLTTKAVNDIFLDKQITSIEFKLKESYQYKSKLYKHNRSYTNNIQNYKEITETHMAPLTIVDYLKNSLMFNEETSNVVIKCADGVDVVAHKLILCRSPVFKAMLLSGMNETLKNVIDISDLTSFTVKNLLQFMYTDTIELNIHNETTEPIIDCDLLLAAKKYQLPWLEHKYAYYISSSINIENCLKMYVLGELCECETLLQSTVKFIVYNKKDILNTQHWNEFVVKYPTSMVNLFKQVLFNFTKDY